MNAAADATIADGRILGCRNGSKGFISAVDHRHDDAVRPIVQRALDVVMPIRRHPRVVLTPHAAYYSLEGYIEMRTKAAREILRALTGEAVHNPVNLHCLINPRAAIPRLSPPQDQAGQ